MSSRRLSIWGRTHRGRLACLVGTCRVFIRIGLSGIVCTRDGVLPQVGVSYICAVPSGYVSGDPFSSSADKRHTRRPVSVRQSVTCECVQISHAHDVHGQHRNVEWQARDVRDGIANVLRVHHMLSSDLSVGLQDASRLAASHVRRGVAWTRSQSSP